MGKSSTFSTDPTDSCGNEICSDTYTTGGGYIDFTYPYVVNPAYYAGRMFFQNNYGYFAWNNNWMPFGFEGIASTHQMIVDRGGF